jgi:DHA2 family multidrug resistance protein-like MFS transporter
MSVETATPARRAGRREWIGLAVLALPCLLYAMDLTVLYLAMPSLTRDLHPSSSQLLWISDIYGFMVAGFLITMGTLGDRIGRRKLLLVGAGAFGVASAVAAFSSSASMLIATRALMGIAGATLAPSTLSLIRNMFHDSKQRTAAISVWGTSFAVGGAIGPLVGGVMLEHFWWGSVFLLAVPVMVLLLAVGPRLLPEFRTPGEGRIDLRSAAMSLGAVLGVIYGLKQIAQEGVGAPAVASIAAGIAVGVAFARRQSKLPDPLIDLRLFRVPKFSVATATTTLGAFVVFGTFLFTAQYLQLVVGLSPLQAGLWTLPQSVAVITGSMLAPTILRYVRRTHAVTGGLLLAAVGLMIFTRLDGSDGLAVAVIGSVIFSLGLGPVFILAIDLIVGTAPPERAGAASAISETGSEFGGALGIAILGSIGTAVYRGRVGDAIPAGIPSKVAEAARDTLGGALSAAESLPDRLGAPLADTARSAFASGLRLTAVIGAIIAIGIAVLVATLLRDVETQTTADEGATARETERTAARTDIVLEPACAEC